MAQAVAEHVQEEYAAEEEAVGGPQMLDALQVRGGAVEWGLEPGGAGWQRLTPAASRCPAGAGRARRGHQEAEGGR